MRDAVEPRPEVPNLGPARKREPCLQERLLQDILGTGIGKTEGAAQVPQQRGAIAMHERLKRPLVPIAHEREQPLIGLTG